jgi:DNA ligase-1
LLGAPLYRIDSKGKLRVLFVNVIDNGETADVVQEAGIDGGKLVPNRYTVHEGKNLGKSNETTPLQQATLEALSKIESKLREGYVTDKSQAKAHTLRSGIKAPMLAQKYDPTGKQSGSKTLEKMKLVGKRVAVQPKYDGNRCEIVVNFEGATMYSRKGDIMVQLPHIVDEIAARYNELRLLEEITLDGELFSDEISFSTLNGLLRKQEKVAERQAQAETIYFRLYDTYSEKFYEDRLDAITRFSEGMINVKLTPTDFIVATDENIMAMLDKYLSEGHEGLMIRTLDSPYVHKRSWSLVKAKLFEDKEFELVRMERDKRGDMVGKFILKMDVEAYGRDGKLIETFEAGVADLSHEEARELWKNRDEYVGKMGTVVFALKRSKYNVPLFGKLKGFRTDA